MKGCQREMIVLRTTESPLFESAYFMLRRDREFAPPGDMLAEANRLLGASEPPAQSIGRGRRAFSFLLGFLMASLLFGAVLAIVCLCT